jgi:hypothetical protein
MSESEEWKVEEKTPDARWWGGGRLFCDGEKEREIYGRIPYFHVVTWPYVIN